MQSWSKKTKLIKTQATSQVGLLNPEYSFELEFLFKLLLTLNLNLVS